ncbi:NAD(P)-binding Rossmann-fold containing protein [Pochonia chlamydosporia 170]|uniref:Dehydrogenase FUB6 n=1 Tax=Pochonia chlamydosporia 170 TaxID=1380566 RepID=A0A179G8Q6_METCM|nr:NAD(P)-binding Rossmann-fold containing protein [Pochonia chlamydosporia 170]OAQ73880.2 NAD(P)-binding Rossmann-fold containing protein [Pochonia chlamydosporia 170]
MYPNKSLIYKKYTPYTPKPGENITVECRPFDADAAPPPGGLTVKHLYLSLDPYQRGQMRLPTDTGTYSQPWIEDQPAVVTTLSIVLRSDVPSFCPGDLISAMAPAAEFAFIPAELVPRARVLPPLPEGLNIAPPTVIGALGVAGLSAYVSFHEFVKEPRTGKTMFVSAASGGVGQIVGQLGKMNGMKVIGSTGSAEKVDFVVNELGYDGAWNYKADKTKDALERLAPEGLDVYYDNVGGEQLETALTKMKDFGTIVSSGMVSVYNYPEEEKYGIKTVMNIFLKRLTIYGFICSDPVHLEKYLPTFARDMVTWIAQGKIKTREEVVEGIAGAPEAMVRMFNGDKFGKIVIKVDRDE